MLHKLEHGNSCAYWINYKYKGSRYGLLTNGDVTYENNVITVKGTDIYLTPVRQ